MFLQSYLVGLHSKKLNDVTSSYFVDWLRQNSYTIFTFLRG